MATNTEYDYGTLRLKQSTIDFLKDMKLAFEASYQKKFTMSEFLEQMTNSVEDGDPGVWEIYCTQQAQKNELRTKIEASQRMRKLKFRK